MKIMRISYHLTFFLCIICLFVSGQQPEIRAGVAQVNITPRIGYPHYRGVSTGIADSLYVKAFVLRQGSMSIALAVCDLLWIERNLSTAVRLKVAAQTGIPYMNIILTATHTHTGPAYHRNIYELNGPTRYSSDDEAAIAMDNYPSWLEERIVLALVQGFEQATQVYLECGSGELNDVSFNRRFVMANGKVLTNPGRGNTAALYPAGPNDPDVGVLFIRKTDDNSLLACISSFANHSDTYGGTAFGADYPGFLATALTSQLGNSIVSIYLQGASGDLNHVDVKNPEKKLTSAVIGKKLAATVLAQVPQVKRVKHPLLDARSVFVYAPLQAYSDEELRWSKQQDARHVDGDSPLFKRRRPMKIRSLERIRGEEAVPPAIATEPWTLPLEVQVFRIGEELAIVGLPGEVFAELGLAIKAASPFRNTMIVELTNAHIAYVPTRQAFSQGGYETLNSRLAPGGGELLVKAAVGLLAELASRPYSPF